MKTLTLILALMAAPVAAGNIRCFTDINGYTTCTGGGTTMRCFTDINGYTRCTYN